MLTPQEKVCLRTEMKSDAFKIKKGANLLLQATTMYNDTETGKQIEEMIANLLAMQFRLIRLKSDS